MPRPMRRPASRPGQTRGGRRGRLEAFERSKEGSVATLNRGTGPGGAIEIPTVVTVGELAQHLGVPPTQVIAVLIKSGTMATINQTLDYETAAIVATELGFEVHEQTSEPEAAAPAAPEEVETEDESLLLPRPPVVTIMGHVDHGKTSLLDAIRETKVASGEAGGITQHIGAYQVDVNKSRVTFLDTPGHEAFTAMRARGAQATDIAVVVVAADDGVMPQTREAIDHAKAAGVPIVVAINKIDVANAQPDRVKQELTENGVVVTEYGGTTEAVEVSARTGQGLDTLLETILLVAEAEVNPRANPNRSARGVVIEASMDKARGSIATLLVQRGTLHVGDVVLVGSSWGKLKALFNDRGQRVKEAPPSFPVEVLGLNGVPVAGDRFRVFADERAARAAAEAAARANLREGETDNSVEAVFARVRSASIKETNVIVKADVQGSVEPIVSSIEKLGTPGETRAKVIHSGLGNVNVSDVNLAIASKALVVAFNVRTEPDARRAADLNGVSVRDYNVIYTLIEDIEAMLAGQLEPRYQEVVQSHVEIRATFKAGRRIIAGCFVLDGTVHRRDRVRVKRGNETVWDGEMESLRRVKDDVAEVREGFECGILLDGFDDIQIGDVLEAYTNERI